MDILALIRKNLILLKAQIKRYGQLIIAIVILRHHIPHGNQRKFANFAKKALIV